MEEKREKSGMENAGNGDDDIDGLRQKNEELARQVKSKDEAISRLEADLAVRKKEIAGLAESRDGAVKKAEELGKTLAGTVAAYREIVVGANPGMVGELIKGDSVAEVNESLKKAQALVEKVRQGIEVEAGKTRVPAGAPPRTQPELSGLTAREKIRYGIQGNIKS